MARRSRGKMHHAPGGDASVGLSLPLDDGPGWTREARVLRYAVTGRQLLTIAACFAAGGFHACVLELTFQSLGLQPQLLRALILVAALLLFIYDLALVTNSGGDLTMLGFVRRFGLRLLVAWAVADSLSRPVTLVGTDIPNRNSQVTATDPRPSDSPQDAWRRGPSASLRPEQGNTGRGKGGKNPVAGSVNKVENKQSTSHPSGSGQPTRGEPRKSGLPTRQRVSAVTQPEAPRESSRPDARNISIEPRSALSLSRSNEQSLPLLGLGFFLSAAPIVVRLSVGSKPGASTAMKEETD